MKGLPEGIAALRRDCNVDLVLFGDRVTFKRQQRRLIEVGGGDQSVHPCWPPACVGHHGAPLPTALT